MVRPKVPDVVPVIRKLYERSPIGCCLHVQIDDGNLEDKFFTSEIQKEVCELCLPLFYLLKAMSVTGRKKAARLGKWACFAAGDSEEGEVMRIYCTHCGTELQRTEVEASFIAPGEEPVRTEAFEYTHPEPHCDLWRTPDRVRCLPIDEQRSAALDGYETVEGSWGESVGTHSTLGVGGGRSFGFRRQVRCIWLDIKGVNSMGVTLHCIVEELHSEGVPRPFWSGVSVWHFGKDYALSAALWDEHSRESGRRSWPTDTGFEAAHEYATCDSGRQWFMREELPEPTNEFIDAYAAMVAGLALIQRPVRVLFYRI